MEIEKITELVENQSLFLSRGFSQIKITRDGKPVAVSIPIRSTGVDEYHERIKDQAPRPPVIIRFYKAGSKEAEALGVQTDVKVCEFDYTDKDFVDANDAYFREFPWKLVVYALDMTLKKADGAPAETYEEKKRVLQSNGITGSHVDQILKDIRELTKFTEEQTDFLSKS